jgi:hypothetical protein
LPAIHLHHSADPALIAGDKKSEQPVCLPNSASQTLVNLQSTYRLTARLSTVLFPLFSAVLHLQREHFINFEAEVNSLFHFY